MTWAPGGPGAEALEALAAIAAPSRPRPLPASTQVAPGSFAIDLSREEVIAAYDAPDAPVPPGSRLEMRDEVAVVVSPFGETALLFSRREPGCIYRFPTDPTLVIEGPAPLASGAFYTAVGYDDTDMNSGKPRDMLIAGPTIDGKPWVLLAGQFDSTEGNDGEPPQPSDVTTATFVQCTFAEAQQAGKNWNPPQWPAKLERDPDGVLISVEAETSYGPLRVRARRTHSVCSLATTLGEDPAQSIGKQVTCTKKDRSAPVEAKIINIGGSDEKGAKWRLDQAGAVAAIEAGEKFYVQLEQGEDLVPITVATAKGGARYLTAKKQGDRTDLLLHLPACR